MDSTRIKKGNMKYSNKCVWMEPTGFKHKKWTQKNLL